MIGELPTQLEVNGRSYAIRTDMQDILKILQAFNDPELENEEKVYICLFILYRDFDRIPESDYGAAYKAATDFIDCGIHTGSSQNRSSVRTMDWEQDAPLIFPAINNVAGCEVRSIPHLHWWTFMGYFMEIRDGVFSQVISLRAKKARGKKLEKWEREFWAANKDICVLKEKLSEAEQEELERLNKLLD